MSLLQLRTFVEVYRRRSLSEAARAIGITQPAASQHIASLEAQLGRPLFDRHSRGVRPTAIADDLAASIGSSLDTAESALASARARSSRISGTVHIAAPSDLLGEMIAPRLAPLLDAGLDLRLHIGAAHNDSGGNATPAPELFDRGKNLQRQFSCGRQNQRLRLPFGQGRQPLNHRNGERGGFTRTGLRTADHITPGERRRNRLSLNGRRGGKPSLAEIL